MAIVTLDETILIKFICYDCGHIWDENFEGDSTNCPKCNSPDTAKISRTRYG